MDLGHDCGMARWTGVTLELQGDSGDAIRSLCRVTAVCRRARVVSITNEALVIEDRWRPLWVRFLAVALFPFGLVALAYRRTGQLVVLTRPTERDTTEITVTGEASRRLSARMWEAIGQTLLGAAAAGTFATAQLGRWDSLRQVAEGRARSRPWTYTLCFGSFVYVLSAATSSWVIWTDIVGNVILAALLAGFAARLLGLWPNNRLIHAGRAPLPAIR
jgi:hypothetical protein